METIRELKDELSAERQKAVKIQEEWVVMRRQIIMMSQNINR